MAVYAYATEVRPLDAARLAHAENMWSRVVRGCTKQKIQDMPRYQVAMPDLRDRLRVGKAKTEIRVRKIRWPGQLGSQPSHNLALQVVNSLLFPGGTGSVPMRHIFTTTLPHHGL